MQDEAIYRCINAACARGMPRRVNYCPYCGTAQTDGAPPPSREDGRRAAVSAGAEAAAALSGWSDAPGTGEDDAQTPAVTAGAAATASAAASTTSAGPAAPTPSATTFGHSGRPVDPAGSASARGRGIPWPPSAAPAAQPAGRQPIRLRWWIIALAVLWGVWLWAKPSAHKIDQRIDAAIALAQSCQGKQAQDELIALRKSRATPAQLERLQRELNEASSACTRKRQRASAWSEARGGVESALAAGNAERARTRLQAFTKRWGEDDDTRALKARVDAARGDHPLAVPSASGDTPSARNLVREARADMARGDYGAARDKMELCLTMVDPTDRECAALKRDAARAAGAQ